MRKDHPDDLVSLDGFIEGPNREIDWPQVDEELHCHFKEQIRAMGGFLSGRVTHELMVRDRYRCRSRDGDHGEDDPIGP